ncbi:hypothetical protein HK105_205483 [Polyrhizophydium stewartii]|uniref:Uncharacterized protein n=1 Tax=Polyrhizophydium stewartii TaxID=2732419 RepID=A0ABR4N619_9FUNG
MTLSAVSDPANTSFEGCQEFDDEEDGEFCDTIAKVARAFQTTPWLIGKANEIDNVESASLEGRRFLVIPSASTFQDPIWDIDQERHELCRNFLILIRDDDFGLAHMYLGRCNYNLPAAIENYYYDLC